MTIQIQQSESDPRLYTADRDFAHCFDQVVKIVAGRLEDGTWPPLDEFLRDKGITEDQLGLAMQAYCRFVGWALEDPKESMEDVLRRAGWFDLPEEAHIAVMAYTGTVISGMFFHGRRDATIGGKPAERYEGVIKAGEECAEAMTRSRWRRRFTKRWQQLKQKFLPKK